MQLLRKLAFPISLVYALVVVVRNFLYDIGFFKTNTFSTKTLCVGNLSVGGTGKTPMIEYLIGLLEKDFDVVVLSRGYKRKSKGFFLASKNTDVEEIGDEPFQIHSKFPNIHVAVDTNRSRGIGILEKKIKPDIILLDDAFQHRKVKPHFSILLTAYGNLYSNDWYLPMGHLRDSRREAKRADVIVITKCPEDMNSEEQESIKVSLRAEREQLILFSSIAYDSELKGSRTSTIEDLRGTKITLVTGIANPNPLVKYLNKQGLQFEHLSYRDHHFFSDAEIALFNSKEFILTTEKDYVRLKNKVSNVFYITIGHKFLFGGEKQLNSLVRNIMK